MTGLVLSGGGLKGSYEIGAYQAILDSHIKIDGFAGTSIGAINACFMACGKFKELKGLWQREDIGILLGFSEELIKEINENKLSIKELFKSIKDILDNKGLSTKYLKEELKYYNLKKYLYKSKKDFGLITVRAKDFKPIYKLKEEIKPDKLNDYLIATCYWPLFRYRKIIDDNYYLDGGFFDNVPVDILLNKGYNKVYVINLEAIGVKRPYKDKEKIIEIKPSRKISSVINTKASNIKYNYYLGYFDTYKIINNLDGYKYIFKKRSKYYYEYLIRNVKINTRRQMEKLFNTKDRKVLIIKAIEYVLKKEKYNYFKIYRVRKVIKEIKKLNKDYGVYKFLNQLGGII